MLISYHQEAAAYPTSAASLSLIPLVLLVICIMNIQDTKNFITALYDLGERQFAGERKTRRIIEASLQREGVPYAVEEFVTHLPRVTRADLVLDGRRVPCMATSFQGGIIRNQNHLISSLTSSQNFLTTENINFNPLCAVISRSNHYFAPSLAVARDIVPRIMHAKTVRGAVNVRKTAHRSANILVGNRVNPRYLVFSHYDSLFGGAVDNASGTALTLYLATAYPQLRRYTLFVFGGNEELSYDQPIYWGHGYRVFEERHRALLARAEKILVLDCIGFSETYFVKDETAVRLGFPVRGLGRIIGRTRLVIGDMQKMMAFYHSDLDRPHLIKTAELARAALQVAKALSA